MSITASDEETAPQGEAVHAGSDGWMLVAPASPEQADSRLITMLPTTAIHTFWPPDMTDKSDAHLCAELHVYARPFPQRQVGHGQR